MSGIWFQLALIAALVLVNAVLAGSEMALVSLRDVQLTRLSTRGGAGRALHELTREPTRFLATIQVGITVAGFMASASAAVSLAQPVEDRLGFLDGAAGGVSIMLVTIALSYVTLVLGELAPKRIAMQRAEGWALLVARPLGSLSVATRPVVWGLSRSTDVVVRLLGFDPHHDGADVTEEELRDMVAAQVSFSTEQRAIIDGAFEIARRTLREVLRPRTSVFTLDASLPVPEARRALAGSGHSRAPVCDDGELDAVIGVVHLRDLLDDLPIDDLAARATTVTVFPESAHVLDVLHVMQLSRVQMAIVINEHGGAEGIITVEDLIEELVGEIYDETDRDIVQVRRLDDGTLVLSGSFPIHDLPDLGIEVPDGPYSTVAGLVLALLQRVPEAPGDTVSVAGWELTVTGVEERRLTEIRFRPRHD